MIGFVFGFGGTRGGAIISGMWYAAALGWPRRRRGEDIEAALLLPNWKLALLITAGVSALLLSTTGLLGAMYGAIAGPPLLKDNGCSEQTRRVSTPALRRRAQNSWAPRSLEPFNVFAASRNPDLSNKS